LYIIRAHHLAIFSANFFILANIFGGGNAERLHGCVPWEGEWDTGLAGLAPSSQTVFIGKAGWKKLQNPI
jgi:hypothetical protein